MGRHLARAVFEAVITIFGLLFLSFVILKLLPGGPFDDEAAVNPIVREHLEKSWGLHGSGFAQFFSYLGSALKGEFGESLSNPGQPVGSILWQSLRASAGLDLVSLLVVFLFGFLGSMLIVLFQGRWQQAVTEVILTIFVSLPSLFLGPLLIFCFAYHWDLFPATQLNQASSYVLPVLALSLRPAAYLARILSSTWKEQTHQDYMKLAQAKGLSFRQAIFKHALKNSLIPAVNYSGPLILHLLSGSFLVELLFVIPGFGTSFVQALSHRDYPVIMGITLFMGIILVLISLAVDILNQNLDPRWKK